VGLNRARQCRLRDIGNHDGESVSPRSDAWPNLDLAVASYSLFPEWNETLPKDFESEIVYGLMLVSHEQRADRVARMTGAHVAVVGNRGVLAATERIKRSGVRVKGECTEGGLEDSHLEEQSAPLRLSSLLSDTKGDYMIDYSGEPVHECDSKRIAKASLGILGGALRFTLGLSRAPVVRVFHGVRPYAPGSLPILGEPPAPRGFLAACGLGDERVALGRWAYSSLLVRSSIKRAELRSPSAQEGSRSWRSNIQWRMKTTTQHTHLQQEGTCQGMLFHLRMS